MVSSFKNVASPDSIPFLFWTCLFFCFADASGFPTECCSQTVDKAYASNFSGGSLSPYRSTEQTADAADANKTVAADIWFEFFFGSKKSQVKNSVSFEEGSGKRARTDGSTNSSQNLDVASTLRKFFLLPDKSNDSKTERVQFEQSPNASSNVEIFSRQPPSPSGAESAVQKGARLSDSIHNEAAFNDHFTTDSLNLSKPYPNGVRLATRKTASPGSEEVISQSTKRIMGEDVGNTSSKIPSYPMKATRSEAGGNNGLLIGVDNDLSTEVAISRRKRRLAELNEELALKRPLEFAEREKMRRDAATGSDSIKIVENPLIRQVSASEITSQSKETVADIRPSRPSPLRNSNLRKETSKTGETVCKASRLPPSTSQNVIGVLKAPVGSVDSHLRQNLPGTNITSFEKNLSTVKTPPDVFRLSSPQPTFSKPSFDDARREIEGEVSERDEVKQDVQHDSQKIGVLRSSARFLSPEELTP